MPAVFRYGVRPIHKSPRFTLAAAVGLALGIGANVASALDHELRTVDRRPSLT